MNYLTKIADIVSAEIDSRNEDAINKILSAARLKDSDYDTISDLIRAGCGRIITPDTLRVRLTRLAESARVYPYCNE